MSRRPDAELATASERIVAGDKQTEIARVRIRGGKGTLGEGRYKQDVPA